MSEPLSMNTMLATLRALAQAAQEPAAPDTAAPPPPGADFATVFKGALEHVNATQNRANALAESFEAGAPGVDLSDVMVNLQKSRVVFQATLQVRNKLVAAYQDIMNMPL